MRELENLLERLVVLTVDNVLGVEFLPDKMLHTLPEEKSTVETTLELAIGVLKRRMIVDALQQEGFNKVAAARRLGISRSYLHRLISEYELAD